MSAPDPHRRADPADAPLHWAVDAGAVDDVIREMDTRVAARRRRRRRLRACLAAAASVSLLALAAFFHFRPSASTIHPSSLATAITTTVSLPERQTLPDGSTVELKPGAQISVAFTEHVRRVTLVSGEAHFQVAKNPDRPFVVVAGPIEFRAVGTAFTIDLSHAAAELVVTEGRVAVDDPRGTDSSGAAAAPQTLALVHAGHKLFVPSDSSPRDLDPAATPLAQRVEPLAADQLAQRLAWRIPRLEFSGTPLAEALPLFNQHSPVRLTLGHAALAQVRLSGVLRADNADILVSLLEESHGIRVEKRSATDWILHPRR